MVDITTMMVTKTAVFFQPITVPYQLSPYRNTIDTLRHESLPGAALILTSYDHHAYDWLYPYLRHQLSFSMLDDYAPPGESVAARTTVTLEQIARAHRDWWLFDSDPGRESPSEVVLSDWLGEGADLLGVRDLDGGRLYRYRLR